MVYNSCSNIYNSCSHSSTKTEGPCPGQWPRAQRSLPLVNYCTAGRHSSSAVLRGANHAHRDHRFECIAPFWPPVQPSAEFTESLHSSVNSGAGAQEGLAAHLLGPMDHLRARKLTTSPIWQCRAQLARDLAPWFRRRDYVWLMYFPPLPFIIFCLLFNYEISYKIKTDSENVFSSLENLFWGNICNTSPFTFHELKKAPLLRSNTFIYSLR